MYLTSLCFLVYLILYLLSALLLAVVTYFVEAVNRNASLTCVPLNWAGRNHYSVTDPSVAETRLKLVSMTTSHVPYNPAR